MGTVNSLCTLDSSENTASSPWEVGETGKKHKEKSIQHRWYEKKSKKEIAIWIEWKTEEKGDQENQHRSKRKVLPSKYDSLRHLRIV